MAAELFILGCLVLSSYGITEGVPSVQVQSCNQCARTLLGLRQAIQDEMTTDDLLELSDLCDVLPAESKSTCQMFLYSYQPSVSEEDLARLCKAVKMCDAKAENQQVMETLFFRSVADADTVQDGETSIFVCTICQKFMAIAQKFLSDPKKRERLLNVLKALCKHLPIAQNVCTYFVQQYGPLVLDLLANIVNPELCKTIGLCQKSRGSEHL